MAHVLVRRGSTVLLDYGSNIELLEEFTLDLTVSIVVVLDRLINRVLIWLSKTSFSRCDYLSAIITDAPVAIICAASHYNS